MAARVEISFVASDAEIGSMMTACSTILKDRLAPLRAVWPRLSDQDRRRLLNSHNGLKKLLRFCKEMLEWAGVPVDVAQVAEL